MKLLEYKSYIFGFSKGDSEKGSALLVYNAPFSGSYCGSSSTAVYYYEKQNGFNEFKKNFPFFSSAKWYYDQSNYSGVVEVDTGEKLNSIFVFTASQGIYRVVLNGKTFDMKQNLINFQVFSYGENVGGLFACGNLILFPSEVFGKSFVLTAKVLEDSLKAVLDEKNTDLVLVKTDCPYIPLKSLNGTGGAVYADGDHITLNKLGKTFKVLGSFHFVKDTDLNLTVAYVLGDGGKPSLVVPQLILDTLKGG